MGLAAEVITGKVVNASSTFTALTMATGDSLSIRSFEFSQGAVLENVWAQGATAGLVRVRSPRLADNVQGIRVGYLAATPHPLLPEIVSQRLYPQDVLVAEATGGASETDVVSLMNWYADLPGASARLRSWDEVAPMIVQTLTVETQHTTGGTAGDWGGGLAINANFDLLKANVDYAILGYLTSAAVCSVGYRGPDTGNLRTGGPGTTTRIETRDWFVDLARQTGRPHIPIINAANKGSTTIDLASNATSAAVVVQTILAELRS